MPKIAIVQEPPVVLDRSATLERAIGALGRAADGGAELVVFPETYLPGYPAWIWRLRPGDDARLYRQIHQRLTDNAVRLARGDLEPLQAVAAKRKTTVVVGFHERDEDFGRTTLYNAVAVIGPAGEILNHHRKLMPTDPERMVWGLGDARGLRVVETPVGRLGVLICWENLMPLSRYALYAQGVEIYCAPTYASGEVWLASMRHIAMEGGCWVLNAGCLLAARDFPPDFPERGRLYPDPDEWINSGDSAVVAPGGRIVEGPISRQSGLLFADIDLAQVAGARRTLDVAGHYSRPDVFQLRVDRSARPPAEFAG